MSPSKLLEDQIVGSYERAEFLPGWDQRYVPEGCLERLITKESIIREFTRNDKSGGAKHVDKDLTDYILRSAKKLLAISLLTGVITSDLHRAMKIFKSSGFTDTKLPVKSIDPPEGPPWSTLEWSAVKRDDFKEKQWMFLVPIFREDEIKLKLESRHILPFKLATRDTKQGTFGTVREVEIHESHLEKPMRKHDGSRANAAIKEIKETEGQSEKEARKEWQKEERALVDAAGLKHNHIVEVRAIITWTGKGRYFMFQWADGGNLREFYKKRPRPSLSVRFMKRIVEQLVGLADALNSLHNYKKHDKDAGSYRHGDLKPENILRFEDGTEIGSLKIADMGLAKHHFDETGLRGPTTTRYGTPLYEPPEVVSKSKEARSRQYDIWSMGCVILELIVWLLYGNKELEKFNNCLHDSFRANSPYWALNNNRAQVHPSVQSCMELIGKDQECVGSTAMGDLLSVVRTRLLVVSLPPKAVASRQNMSETASTASTVSSSGEVRAKAEDFHDALKQIMEKGKSNNEYWFTGKPRGNIIGPVDLIPSPDMIPSGNDMNVPTVKQQIRSPNMELSEGDKNVPTVKGPQGGLLERIRHDYTHPPLNNIWEFSVDNDFAGDLVRDIRSLGAFSHSSGAARLCRNCQGMEPWAQSFKIEDTLSDLEQMSPSCDFCRMRWDTCKRLHFHNFSDISFDRLGSMIRINERYPPVFNICREPDFDGHTPVSHLQIGFPELPEAGSRAHLETLRRWLIHCDETHPGCRPVGKICLPTRLIDVGSRAAPTINLYETQPGDCIEYIALSHPWGKPPHFCTTISNVDRYKQTIESCEIPATFKDAITITRSLGVRYLWIDSICIIQGPGGDFSQEAKRMEYVFSQAYCVLAASSARGQDDGFLKPRRRRNHVQLKGSGKSSIYISEFIDDFNYFVLQSRLNQRGWVLQERALARRTIYFTPEQSFWECGSGVRCETLTKMNNTLASFLGDPVFPQVAIESSRGGKIRLYQDLYMLYSRLAFSYQRDRPIAIAGLEKRLIESFDVRGGFGVLDDDGPGLLRRSLLWCRGSDEASLHRINFGGDERLQVANEVPPPPTWSWMAYKGGIDYLNLPFGKVEWEKVDILSPWSSSPVGAWYSSDPGTGITGLSVIARVFDKIGDTTRWNERIIYDTPEESGSWPGVKCVVLGRTLNPEQDVLQSTHYVLLVRLKTPQTGRGGPFYERIGVGYMPGSRIQLNIPGVLARVQ